MNQHLFSVKKSSLVLFSLLAGSSIASAENLKINWTDNSTNEDGFIIEKRFQENDAFEILSTLPANTNYYTDSDIVADQTYCYRVVAYNSSGQVPSAESCLQLNDDSQVVTPIEAELSFEPVYYATTIAISHEFISQPSTIEIGEKELYSFKENNVYNETYSNDGVYNTEFTTMKGSVSYRDRDYFSFQQEGVELSNGYARMAFNTGNSVDFDLKGNGILQSATLYMKAGAWSNNSASVIVTVGNETETITLPKGHSWYYFSVTIEFDGTAPVNISTDSDVGSYSSVVFAGLVLNEKEIVVEVEEAIQYASIISIDEGVNTTIDISDSKFMVHTAEEGNKHLSEANVELLTFYGDSSTSSNRYTFSNDDGESFSGYTKMKWDESNGVSMKLSSGDAEVNTASIYFTAGAWTKESAYIEVVINGQSELVELTSGYSWKSMKLDIDFEGELIVDIHPVGKIGGYSAFKFAGVTLN